MNNKDIKRSVVYNVILKPISVVVSLLYTPILLKYLGTEKYGIWVTILSVTNWITTFDIGIGNGLRNCITKELTDERYDDVCESISTAYKILSSIVFVIYLVAVVVGSFLDWKLLFNTKIEIKTTLFIVFSFVCLNFILSLQNNCYYAIQKSEIVSLINVIIQILNLFGVFLITNIFSHNGDMNELALLIGMSGFVINLLFSFYLWRIRPYFRPRKYLFNRDKLHAICSLGLKFFFIQIAGLVLFTTDSIIISNIFSPDRVTPYNTVYKFFGVGMSLFFALLTPFWSRFTVAKEQEEYEWMKLTIKKMRTLWMVYSTLFIVVVPFFKPIANLWLGQDLYYDVGLVTCMAVYYIAYMYSGIYSTALNGIGDINIELSIQVISAIANIPLSIFLAKVVGMGTTGVCLGTIISLLLGDVVFTVQLNKIIKIGLRSVK